jgi:rSAM/selenodomain-associated transferase 2
VLSVIIPALNEALAIGQTLTAVSRQADDLEVIVVDGGSSDATVEIAQRMGATVLRSECGRGVQLHAGAAASSGNVLWFVHADTRPSPEGSRRIHEALAIPGVVGGSFAVTFDGASFGARMMNRGSPFMQRLGFCYGDSGIFVPRPVYERIGGFRPHPLFEDLDFLQRLKRVGRFVHLPEKIETSSRRFEGRSFALTCAQWSGMQMLYWAGVPPERLARMYLPIRRSGPSRFLCDPKF